MTVAHRGFEIVPLTDPMEIYGKYSCKYKTTTPSLRIVLGTIVKIIPIRTKGAYPCNLQVVYRVVTSPDRHQQQTVQILFAEEHQDF